MSENDARVLFDSLTDRALKSDHTYHHRWRNCDVVMWDNALLPHRRDAFGNQIPRLVERTTAYLDKKFFVVPRAYCLPAQQYRCAR